MVKATLLLLLSIEDMHTQIQHLQMRINPVPFATSILCTHGWPKDLGFLFSLRISLRFPVPSSLPDFPSAAVFIGGVIPCRRPKTKLVFPCLIAWWPCPIFGISASKGAKGGLHIPHGAAAGNWRSLPTLLFSDTAQEQTQEALSQSHFYGLAVESTGILSVWNAMEAAMLIKTRVVSAGESR